MNLAMITNEIDPTIKKLVKDEYRRFLKKPYVREALEKLKMKKNISTEAAFKILLEEMTREAGKIKNRKSNEFL